jgi:cbb3-type cytochrome oxidase subunit 3
MAEALKGGWKGLLNIIVGFIYVWPLILLAVVAIIWIVRRKRKKRIDK